MLCIYWMAVIGRKKKRWCQNVKTLLMDSGAAHKNILSTSEVYNQAPYLRIH